MKKFMLEKSPKVYDWRDSEECCELFTNKWDMEKVEKCTPDAIFYWYVSGSYEGSGQLIATKENKWYCKGLSHCSCYGPIDDFADNILDYTYNSLDELLVKGSEDWLKEIRPLVDLAKSNGYK